MEARNRIHGWLERAGATGRAVSEMDLVVTEICNNAVEHGSATPDIPMTVTANITNGELTLEVLEKNSEAVGSIGEALLDSFAPPSLDEERGRGMFLIRIYVDELQIETADDDHLRVRVRKKL